MSDEIMKSTQTPSLDSSCHHLYPADKREYRLDSGASCNKY